MPDSTLNALIDNLRTWELVLIEEFKKRQAIIDTPAFQKWQAQKEAAEMEMKEMLKGIPDSTEHCDGVRKALVNHMQENRVFDHPLLRIETKQRKVVNTGRLYNVLGGDLDLFQTLAKVTQKDLKAFADENPSLKREILGCVEDSGEEIAKVELATPLDRLVS